MPTDTPTDARLWSLVAGAPENVDLEALVGPCDASGPLVMTRPEVDLGSGRPSRSIEAQTEGELSAIHALWMVGETRAAWRERALAAAGWCVENVQPDNATHEAWALHVFLILGEATGHDGATLYAQTLLQNAMVGGMRGTLLPRRSAWIVRSASEALRRYCGSA